jgi:hypothetical protein
MNVVEFEQTLQQLAADPPVSIANVIKLLAHGFLGLDVHLRVASSRNRARSDTNGRANSSTTSSCSWSTLASGRMKLGGFNSVT